MQENNQILSALTRSGVLLNVSVRYWRARRRLNPEDLGLEPGLASSRLISLGHKKLLPKDALAQFALIESRAHAVAEESTFPFLGGIARFLPNPRIADARERLEALESEFRETRSRFADDYARLRSEALEEWRREAAGLVDSPERLVSAVANSFPEPERLDRYFGFAVHMYQIQVPESLSAELVAFGDQAAIAEAREQAARSAGREIEQSVRAFVRDSVATMRQETARLCEEMLESINGSRTGVHQKTLNRLEKFIDRFAELNFADDRELEMQLEEARRTLLSHTAAEYRDSDYARRRLREGLRGLADTAREMAGQDMRGIVESFGALGSRRITRAA